MRSAECHGEYRSANDPARQFRTPHSTLRTWGGALIDLSGKRAFVTGGGRGIGRATVVMLARAGCRVAVGYRSRGKDAAETVRAVEGGGGRGEAVAIGGGMGGAGAARAAGPPAEAAPGRVVAPDREIGELSPA